MHRSPLPSRLQNKHGDLPAPESFFAKAPMCLSRLFAAFVLACSLALPLASCNEAPSEPVEAPSGAAAASTDNLPAYDGELSIEVNGGQPGFTAEESAPEAADEPFEEYSQLDSLGRCETAFALIGPETLPDKPRGDISTVHPSGWKQARYETIDQKALYNRSHLIAHQLAGEDANERNLITGTRTMNVEGMLPYEELVGDYVRATGNHVLYRVTPVFENDELVARGVQMEGLSVEDGGRAVCFNVFVYNIEPGIQIDYSTGDSWVSDSTPEVVSNDPINQGTEGSAAAGARKDSGGENAEAGAAEQAYVLNVNSKKFHDPSCSSADDISPSNRQDYTGTRDDLIDRGYEPCKICKP